MLELHRASAGSGKTYTLAKKYIWYFLTIKDKNGKRRLRTDAELSDSLRRILAVTFTNKATNEMQMRIVDRLYDLAYKKPVFKVSANGKHKICAPDYMDEFTGQLGCTPEKLAETSRQGLTLLLENYSDFNVSTIDSFFQLVLRTLAYESDLNETFQVELDSKYLSRVAVNATLESIDSDRSDADTGYWIKMLIERNTKGWEIFKKEEWSHGESAYDALVNSVNRLENEDYKLIRHEIERYFRQDTDLRKLYEDLSRKYDEPVKKAFRKMKKAYRRAFDLMPEDMKSANSRTDAGKIYGNAKKLAEAGPRECFSPKLKETEQKILYDKLHAESVGKFLGGSPGIADTIETALADAREAFSEWMDTMTGSEYRLWRVYSENLPYLALFRKVTRMRMDFLDETNSIELGETNMILRGIIGESDAPFVYERLGTVLNHFLIDEFQDTSRLQWENLRPLLQECLTREDSLIIGDAKQSIYRFRNADPSLITSVVPDTFGAQVEHHGYKPEENTNFRSCLHIVQFNNAFFEYFVRELDRTSESQQVKRMKFGPLYANVVQTPNKKEDEGYVEVNFLPGSKQGGSKEDFLKHRIPELVSEMVERGYSQKDIAVLVSTNGQGEKIIQSFIDYNSGCAGRDKEIRFVSEMSLKVSNSRAVKLIVGVLENLSRGMRPQLQEGEERIRKGLGNWREIEANFKFFAMGQTGKSMAQLLDEYIEARPDMGNVMELLGSMQSLAIPAIVEAIVARFIPEEMRKEEAVFIAAFQDLVIEYCERNPTDIGSFLRWWERRSQTASITSPSDTDAVQVLTIHKSKGLEFDCVIIPYGVWDMRDLVSSNKQEWRWVAPVDLKASEVAMPPYIPVGTDEELLGTPHEHYYFDYLDKVKMDYLNSAYVAFTRASRELYIYSDSGLPVETKTKKSNGSKASEAPADKKPEYLSSGQYLHNFLTALHDTKGEERITHIAGEKLEIYQSEEEDLSLLTVTYGHKPVKASQGETSVDTIPVQDYRSTIPSITRLKYRDENTTSIDTEEEEDLDPRSEGNVKHSILEQVVRSEDLHKAVIHALHKGLLNRALASQIENDLKEKLSLPEVKRWFDGSARVISERPLLRKSYVSRRPDRLLVYPDNSIEVVDYKFGKVDTSGKHRRQVKNYMRLLKETGQFNSIKGFLWYVNENRIEPLIL